MIAELNPKNDDDTFKIPVLVQDLQEFPEYFDIKSEHCLMPNIPSSNSFNRNLVLTFAHNGVKYIMDRVAKSVMENKEISRIRNDIVERKETVYNNQ